MIKFCRIDCCAELPSNNYEVYDIEVKDNEHFVANDIITHNCRLRNELDKNDFSYSLGAGGVSTGSTSVMTLNVNRFIQDALKGIDPNLSFEKKKHYVLKSLEIAIKKIQKFQVAHRHIVEDYVNAGLATAYTAGFITLDKQFVTIGINGLNEGAEFLGIEVSNNSKYLGFVADFLATIRDLNKNAKQEFGIKFNTELVPGENLGPKNAKWDLADGYESKRKCYNSYIYLPEDDKCSIPDKFMMHGGIIADSIDGE